MKVVAVICYCIVLFSFSTSAQLPPDIMDPNGKNGHRTPIPYPPLREADLMWSKFVWRIIDVNEKMNLAFKWPPIQSGNQKVNLMDVFASAIKEGTLTPYSYENDEFTRPITWEDIDRRGGGGIDTIEMPDSVPPYDMKMVAISRSFSTDKIIGYQLQEIWYFDKQTSQMKVRIIGVAPMIYAVDQDGNIREGNFKIPLCWFYYSDLRETLANTMAFNRWNNNQQISFDDLFESRFFSSYIIKESNVYDRYISEYMQGTSALLEAEKIKNQISQYEHDMWEE